MNLITYQMPNITNYMQLSTNLSISGDTTLLLVFKSLFRSDTVIIDIYKNEISEDTKIVSGKTIMANSTIANPRSDLDFLYKIECIDEDGIAETVTNRNLHKFYLSFTRIDNKQELYFENIDKELESIL